MSTVVVAGTVALAEKVIDHIDMPGLRPFVATSQRSIVHFQAVRGLVVDRVFVHSSAGSLSFETLADLVPAMTFRSKSATLRFIDTEVDS